MVKFAAYADARVELIKIRNEVEAFERDVEQYGKEERRVQEIFDEEGKIFKIHSEELDRVGKGPTNEAMFARVHACGVRKVERFRELHNRYGGSWEELSALNQAEYRRLMRKKYEIHQMKLRLPKLEAMVKDFEDQVEQYEDDRNSELTQIISEIKDLAGDL